MGDAHKQVYTEFIFSCICPRTREAAGLHLGRCKHLPALQLAHLEQCGHRAHVRAGGGSDPVAVSCQSQEGGVRRAGGSPTATREPTGMPFPRGLGGRGCGLLED